MDSEQSARFLLFGVTAAVLIAAAAFIAIGYYVAVVQPRGRTVLAVDGIEVSYAEMKRRVAFEYYQNPALQNQQSLFSLPQIAYRNLVDELTLVSRAEQDLGFTLTPEEYNKHLRTRVGVAENADDQTFSDTFRRVLADSHLKRNEYERHVRADLLADKVTEKLKEQQPATVTQAKVELIATQDEETAQQAIDRINAGEPFADVAKALSEESDVATTNGVKDFQFDKQMPAAYRDFALTAAVGQLSAPLVDPSGQGAHYVVRVIERGEQPLRDEQKPLYESEAYRQWLLNTQANISIIDKWLTDEEAQASATAPLIQDLIDRQRRAAEEQARPTIQLPTAAVSAALSPVAETPGAETPAPAATVAAATPAQSPPANGQ